MKITISFSLKYLSILTRSTNGVKGYYNYSINVIISLVIIPCFNFVTRMLYIIIIIIIIATIKGSAPVFNFLMEYLIIA